MARYIVTRSSMWDNEKPIQECEQTDVRRVYQVSKNAVESYKERIMQDCEEYKVLEDGGISYVRKEKAWVCEITDLCRFVEKYGRIILMCPDNEEGLWNVEIYDDYRE